MQIPFLNRNPTHPKSLGQRPAVGRLIECIAEVGFQPFIQIDVELDGKSMLLLCVTQQEIAKFADELAAFLRLRASRLLSGRNNAIRAESYDAGERFFEWIMEGEAAGATWIELFPDGSHPMRYSLKF